MKKYLSEIQSKIEKFNDYLADRMSYILSIMSTFYIVAMLVSIPLIYTQPNSIVGWASYLCSVVFQGIALPILGYTSRKASDKSDRIIQHMNETIDKIDKLVQLIQTKQLEIDEEVDEILEIEKKEHK